MLCYVMFLIYSWLSTKRSAAAVTWPSFSQLAFHLKERRPIAKTLGLSNNRLSNRYITASSIWDRYHAAWLARLHNKKRGRYPGGWSAKVNRRGQWIQFDFRKPKIIVKVVTQGRHDYNQWVTRYFIKYSPDAFYWAPYKKYSRVQVSDLLHYQSPASFLSLPSCPYMARVVSWRGCAKFCILPVIPCAFYFPSNSSAKGQGRW